MKHISTLVFLIVYQLSYSQACGSGRFIFDFYTKDNEKLKYQITEVEIIDDNLLSGDIYRGIKIDSSNFRGIKQLKLNKNKLPKLISDSLSCKGKITNNQLVFNTLELFNKPFLLKIWNKKSEILILVNLFGGCDRRNIIVMKEVPILILGN